MRHLTVISLLFLPIAIVTGCSEESAPSGFLTDSSTVEAAESLRKIQNAPALSGVVVRGEGPSGTVFTWVDAEKGMRVTISADMADFCDGDPVDWDILHFQTVFREARLVTRIQEDDQKTAVWPFTDFDCGLFTTVEPVATGYADFMRIDNDFCRDDPRCNFTGGNNAKAWGMHGKGNLTRPGGEGAIFSGHFRGLNESLITSRITLQ